MFFYIFKNYQSHELHTGSVLGGVAQSDSVGLVHRYILQDTLQGRSMYVCPSLSWESDIHIGRGLFSSNKNATPTQIHQKSRNPNFLVQIQMKSKSQFKFVLRDTEESGFLDFGDEVFSVETVIHPKYPEEYETGIAPNMYIHLQYLELSVSRTACRPSSIRGCAPVWLRRPLGRPRESDTHKPEYQASQVS